VRFIKRKNLSLDQKRALFELWNSEFPKNLQYADIVELEKYISRLNDPVHILLTDENDKIKGWCAHFIRDDERWFLAILNSDIQGKKFGTQIIELAKQGNAELNGWIINSDEYIKANGESYKSPSDFYKKQGFQILEKVTLKTDQISAIKIKWCKTG